MSVTTRALTARYGPRTVLHGIDLLATSGRMLGIVGPNGSGKSTLIKALAGLLGHEGQILFGGSRDRPRSIGYMPQDLQTPQALTVLDVVLLGRLGELGLRVGNDDLAAARDVVTHLAEFSHQLDALRLATTERGRRLPERQVTQSHVLEQLQRVADGRHGGEEVHRLVDLHLQDLADVLAAPADRQGFGVEARAAAGFTQHLHVGQETHGHRTDALPLATRTAAFAGIETEAVGGIPARTRLERVGEQLADGSISSIRRVRRAHYFAQLQDRVFAFQCHQNHRTLGHELHQRGEERTSGVNSVEAFRLRLAELCHAESHNAEAIRFEEAENLTCVAVRHCVGFND